MMQPVAPLYSSRVDQTLARLLPPLEAALSVYLSQRLVHGLTECLIFGIKQAWACLFGGLLLAAMLLSALLWPADAPLSRYDFLVLYAVAIQALFLVTRLERPGEALVILIFHGVGTAPMRKTLSSG